jgi:iron complex transport system substrate-binding protein
MIALALLFLLFPCSMAVDYPVGITNCGISSWIPKAPTRAVTLNQGTTEVMLALGLADRMVGTAYLDDEIWPEHAEDYATVPVLSERYPDPNDLMALQPDFLYASYSSAFDTTSENAINYTAVGYNCTLQVTRNEGDIRTYCRQELHDTNIATYLQTPYCERPEDRSEASLDELRDEIWTIAAIFDALENGRALLDSIDEHFAAAMAVTEAAAAEETSDPITVLWLDSWDDETPFVGACCGAVQVILEHAGAKNIFDDQGLEETKSWDSVSWEEIEARDPDLIVLVDASWDSAGTYMHLQKNLSCNRPSTK